MLGRGAVGRIAVVALAGILSLQAQTPAQDVDTIRSDVQLVRVLATVRDANGRLVSGLQKEHFQIVDEGVKQQIRLFEKQSEQPLSISLLVDSSGSTRKENKAQNDAVRRFLKALFTSGNPDDQLSLYTFNYEVNQRTNFTRNYTRLDQALAAVESTAGTALYDAIWFASEDLQEREGRRVLIVITDGSDTVSRKGYQDALKAVQRADAVVYPIVVIPIKGDAGRSLGGENAMATLSRTTGGASFQMRDDPVKGPVDLDRIFKSILEELRTQYLLGYYPAGVTSPKGGFHRIAVSTSDTGLKVSARTGYFAPETK